MLIILAIIIDAGQEATVRTGHGTTDWFQIGKGVRQGCMLSPCLFNLYAEYIMRNTGLDEAQAGIKIAGRNTNNLRRADAAAAAKSHQLCPTVRPHRWQATRLLCPWDSPGKNTGVGCHFLLQCTKVKSESEVTQSCLTLIDPMNCSPPGSSVHGIFQARILEWVAIACSRCADDTILMAESEELKSLLMKVKEESENIGLKLNI